MAARRSRLASLAAISALALAGLGASSAGAARDFPRDFLWGTANAGFQSEAGQGRNADPNSDWFAWTHDPQNIADGTVSGDQPEDGPGFWKRYRSDLRLASKQLNNTAFRFSIEWSRIFPRSTEPIEVGARISKRELERLDRRANQAAVRHYAKLLERAGELGLTPFVTLHHWTIPTWLHDPIAARDGARGQRPERRAAAARARRLARPGDGRGVPQVLRLPGLEARRTGRLLEHAERAAGRGHLRLRERPRPVRGLLATRRLQLHRRGRRADQPRAREHRRLRRAQALRPRRRRR